jgi:hypothetical protein
VPVAVAVADADDVADELVVAVAEDVAEGVADELVVAVAEDVAESVAADLVAVADDEAVAEDDELADELPVAELVAEELCVAMAVTGDEVVALVVRVRTVPGPAAVWVLLRASGAVKTRSALLAAVKMASPSSATGLVMVRGPRRLTIPKASGWSVPPAKLRVPVPKAAALPSWRTAPSTSVVPPV